MEKINVKEKLMKIIGSLQDCGAVIDDKIYYQSCTNKALAEILIANNVSVFPCRPGQTVYEIIYDSVIDEACIRDFPVDDVSFKGIDYGKGWIDWEDAVNLYFSKAAAEKASEDMKNLAVFRRKVLRNDRT